MEIGFITFITFLHLEKCNDVTLKIGCNKKGCCFSLQLYSSVSQSARSASLLRKVEARPRLLIDRSKHKKCQFKT
jgi:hypothetical protein